MPEIEKDLMTYKDVTKLDLIPAKDFVGFTDMVLLVQNDATRRATLYTLLDKLKDAVTVVNGKSAYELAVDHGFIGSEEEWLKSIGSSADLKAIAGNYVVIDAGWSGNSLVPTNPDLVTVPEGAMIIYQVKQKAGSDSEYLYYTINAAGTGYDKWDGLLPMTLAMEEIVKTFTPDKLYYYNNNGNGIMSTLEFPIKPIFYTSKEFKYTDADDSVTKYDIENHSVFLDETQKSFGKIYEVKDIDNNITEWQFNVYGYLHKYEGIAQYIQTLMSELSPVASSAKKLSTERTIWVTNTALGAWAVNPDGSETPSEELIIGSATFDGSKNVSIEFKDGMINAALLSRNETEVVDGKVAINILGSAEKLATARTLSLEGIVSGSVTFDGSADVTILTSVNMDKIVAGSAKKLLYETPVVVVGGGSNEGNTTTDKTTGAITYYSNIGTRADGTIISGHSIYTWYPSMSNPTLVNKYDGVKPTQLVLTRVNASILYGDDDADINIKGSAQSAKTFKVAARKAANDMVFAGVVNNTDLSDGQSVIYDRQVYVQNQTTSGTKSESGKPTVVAPQFKGNLIGNAKTATESETANLLKTYSNKYEQSEGQAFRLCSVETTQAIDDPKNFSVDLNLNWAASVFINSRLDANDSSSYILTANTMASLSATTENDETKYTISLAGISASVSDLAEINSAIATTFNNTCYEIEHHLCETHMGGREILFGLKFETNVTDTSVTLWAVVYFDIKRGGVLPKRDIEWSISSFGALPMPKLEYTQSISGLDGAHYMFFSPNKPHTLRAKPNTDYTTYRFRNISLGTSSTPTANAVWGGNGSIYFQYS